VLIELATMIVETVTELVAHDKADTTEIHRVIHGCIEESWLQQASREHDLHQRRALVGVNVLEQ
jgi:glutathionylspermidine synthase